MKQRPALRSILLSSLLFSSASFAIEPGMYFGLNAISGSVESNTITTTGTAETPSEEYELDNTNLSGGGLTVGYASSRYFAIELAADVVSDQDYVTTDGTNQATRSQAMGYFAAKPIIPLGSKFNVFARLGVAYVDVDVSFDNADVQDDFSEANWDPYSAIGLSFTPTPSIEIGLGYNRISDNNGEIKYGSLEFNYHSVPKRNKGGFLLDD